MYYTPLFFFVVVVVDLDEGAAVFDGELRDDRNRPKHLAVTPDVVVIDTGQNDPGLEASIYCLVTRVDAGLLPLVGDGVAGVVGALDLVGGADVAVVGFNALAGLEEVTQDLVKDLDVIEGAGGVGALNPNEVTTQNTYPDLVSEGGPPPVFVGCEGIPPD